MTNNDIFKKLRVAHKLTNTDIVAICKLADFTVSESELGAFFRRDDHIKYRNCGDQILRNFLNGLIIHLRGPMPDKRTPEYQAKLKEEQAEEAKKGKK
jgi:uncharacterized protein YehS (DUF1456 family)